MGQRELAAGLAVQDRPGGAASQPAQRGDGVVDLQDRLVQPAQRGGDRAVGAGQELVQAPVELAAKQIGERSGVVRRQRACWPQTEQSRIGTG